MESLRLWEALELWFSGQTLDDYAIGPFPIVLIGRTGAALSLLGGSVVVLDLAGVERIRNWGGILRSQPLTRLRKWIASSWVIDVAFFLILCTIGNMFSETLMGLVLPILEPLHDFYFHSLPSYADWITLLTIVGIICVGFRINARGRRGTAKGLWWCAGILWILTILPTLIDLIGIFTGFVAGGIILFVSLTILSKVLDGLIFVLEPLVIRPVAWAFAHKTPGQPIRWAGFFVLLAGQLLELVAA